MLTPNDVWLMDEELPVDEPVEVLLTMPEIRQLFDPARSEEEPGLRSILERPEALSHAWRRSAHADRQQRTSRSVKRHADVLRAA